MRSVVSLAVLLALGGTATAQRPPQAPPVRESVKAASAPACPCGCTSGAPCVCARCPACRQAANPTAVRATPVLPALMTPVALPVPLFAPSLPVVRGSC